MFRGLLTVWKCFLREQGNFVLNGKLWNKDSAGYFSICLPAKTKFLQTRPSKKHSIYLCLLIPEPSRYSIKRCSNKMTLFHQALSPWLLGAYLEKCVAVNLNQDALRICELILPCPVRAFYLWSWNHHLHFYYGVSLRITNLWIILNTIDLGDENSMGSIPLHKIRPK